MPLHACTIVARNYLPHARVLATSFLAHHPGSRFTTLVIDDREHATQDEPFEVLHLDELLPTVEELHLLATYYDVMELATAVKPLLLLRLLRETAGPVAYLDPDIEVYASLELVAEAAGRAGIVLTPHTTVPYPRDGLRPSEAEIMGAGIYNLGFIGVAPGSEDFLRWWWERLQRDAVVDPERMLFTDQRWIDFVPGLFPHEILKDPGLNVAYWNLHGRQVSRTGDGHAVDGQPLRFFHFSGYSPFDPASLSKHQGDHPRVRLQDVPAVAELARAYGDHLVAAGLVRTGGPRYGWGSEGAFVLDRPMRRAFQSEVRAADAGAAELPPHPFGGDGGAAFASWLAQPAPGRTWKGVNRYLYAAYDSRPDVRSVYPETRRGSERGYLDWAAQGGLAVSGTAAALAGQVHAASESALPGVQVVGYLTAELGMGEYGRQLVAALQAAGAPVATTTWTETLSRQQHHFEELHGTTTARVNLLVVNADQTPVLARTAGPGLFDGRYTVGAWAWEVEDFPAQYDEAFDHVDEVWAISDFTRDAIARRTSKPVHSVPPPVPLPQVDDSISRADVGLPAGFLFLFTFDFLSVPKRKNALGAIEAFSRAFTPGEGPTLVVKSINGHLVPDAREAVRAAAEARPDVLLLEDYLSSEQRTALMAHADCYVSLHRSEGFGLTMAEAMALGKPVIATGYSGNMTFMTEVNSLLVPYDLVPVGDDARPYPPDARWAEPRLDVAAEHMRRAWTDPELRGSVGARAALDVRRHHSAAARAATVSKRLAEIAPRLPAVSPTSGAASGTLSRPRLQRGLDRARVVARVVRTPEMRRAAVRRRLSGAVSAGLGQSRRSVAQQEATRREVNVLRSRVELVAQELDAVAQKAPEAPSASAGRLSAGLARVEELEGRLALLERRAAALEVDQPRPVPPEGPGQPARQDPVVRDPAPGVHVEVGRTP